MARFEDFVPQGVIPAVLLPFHDDLTIDEPSFRSHLRDVADVEGLSAVTINAARPRWRPARPMSRAACLTSRETRSATGCR